MDFKQLKDRYKKAVKDKAETFIIEGHEIVVGYAKYLIEHLNNQGLTDTTEIELCEV